MINKNLSIQSKKNSPSHLLYNQLSVRNINKNQLKSKLAESLAQKTNLSLERNPKSNKRPLP